MPAPPPIRRRYVIHHDGQFLYYLNRADFGARDSRIEQLDLYADDTPMTRLDAKNYQGGWFAADHRAHQILVQDPPTQVPTGYTLADAAMQSAKYPLTVTVEQWQDMSGDENRWQYRAQCREDPGHLTALATDTGDWLQIEGAAPPKSAEDTPAWVPDLMPGLMERGEFHHLMPGYIPGLPAHLGQILERRLGSFRVGWDRDGRADGVRAEVLVPFEQPVTRFVPNVSSRTGKTLRGGKHEQRTVTRTLRLPVPQRIHGENYEAAVAAWRAAVEYWLGVVEAVRSGSARACNHCGGHGFVGGDVFTEFDAPSGVWPAT